MCVKNVCNKRNSVTTIMKSDFKLKKKKKKLPRKFHLLLICLKPTKILDVKKLLLLLLLLFPFKSQISTDAQIWKKNLPIKECKLNLLGKEESFFLAKFKSEMKNVDWFHLIKLSTRHVINRIQDYGTGLITLNTIWELY